MISTVTMTSMSAMTAMGTTTTKGDTTNGEMPPCWSLDGNPNDDDKQSQLALLCSFFITFLLYLRTYTGGDKHPIYIYFTCTMNL